MADNIVGKSGYWLIVGCAITLRHHDVCRHTLKCDDRASGAGNYTLSYVTHRRTLHYYCRQRRLPWSLRIGKWSRVTRRRYHYYLSRHRLSLAVTRARGHRVIVNTRRSAMLRSCWSLLPEYCSSRWRAPARYYWPRRALFYTIVVTRADATILHVKKWRGDYSWRWQTF